ncbi:RNA polymerase sigma factor [Rubrobacter aplysinae]|uniref:RNA polymerase sigma factor n=1 Tax=Rubrobacter aplysinae TaxID=909625 RepID=UPI00064C10F1|nr:RNA polymerase sigma factor [Rubrobacter aplysinae]
MSVEEYGLIHRASRGNVEAFTQLVRQHSDLVYRVALRILGPETAKDASQEVWVRVWKALEDFRADSAFSTWLYKVTVNTCLSELRRERGRTEREEEHREILSHLQDPDGAGDPEAAALGRERQEEAIRYLQELRPDHRAALVLRHLEGLSYAEISDVLEVPEGTAKGWVSRGRTAMFVMLSQNGGDGATDGTQSGFANGRGGES